MTTTNVYQGLNSDKSNSRVLQAPGGGSSNIFGHYQEEDGREQSQRRQREVEAVTQSVNRGGAGDDGQNNFLDNKDSFAANRQRNHGDGAPFATSDSLISTGEADRPAHHQQVVGADYQTPQQRQAANRNRNQGQGAPFATGNDQSLASYPERAAHHQQTLGDDYQTPQQRQANNPNKAGNSFSNLFGDSDAGGMNDNKARGKVSKYNPVTWSAKQRSRMPGGCESVDTVGVGRSPAGYTRADEEEEAHHLRITGALTVSQFNPVTWSAKAGARTPALAFSPDELALTPAGIVVKSVLADESIKPLNPYTKVSTHNPVTWEAYSNFDADKDHPQHRSRFENFASTKAGTFNPITGQEHQNSQHTSTKVHAPPGGKSSIQF